MAAKERSRQTKGWEAHTISEEEPLFTQFLQRVPHNFKVSLFDKLPMGDPLHSHSNDFVCN